MKLTKDAVYNALLINRKQRELSINEDLGINTPIQKNAPVYNDRSLYGHKLNENLNRKNRTQH